MVSKRLMQCIVFAEIRIFLSKLIGISKLFQIFFMLTIFISIPSGAYSVQAFMAKYFTKKPILSQQQLTTPDNSMQKKIELFQRKVEEHRPNMIKKFGFDPKITVYPASDQNVINDHPIIYFHGVASDQKDIDWEKRNTDLFPGTVIGFNFKGSHRSATYPLSKLKDLYFGQGPDKQISAYVLKLFVESGFERVPLYGKDVGADTISIALAGLARYAFFDDSQFKVDYSDDNTFSRNIGKPSTSFQDKLIAGHFLRPHSVNKKIFNDIGIGKKEAKDILGKVKQGTVVLDCPLGGPHEFNSHQYDKWLKYPFLGRCYIAGMAWLTGTKGVRLNYEENNLDTHIYAAPIIQKLNLKMLVSGQKKNPVTGEAFVEKLYPKLMASNTKLILGNDDGGHFHRGQTLAPAMHAFNKENGGPYLEKLAQEGERRRLIVEQPKSPEGVRTFIKNSYANLKDGFIPHPNRPWQQEFKDLITQEDRRFHFRIFQGDSLINDNENVTLYLHGLHDNPAMCVPLYQKNSFILPGPVATFNYANISDGKIARDCDLSKTDLGQDIDIGQTLYVLKKLSMTSLKIISIVGSSRGGATAKNAIKVINGGYLKHKELCDKHGITEDDMALLRKKTRHGAHVANVPLLDSKTSARESFLPYFLATTLLSFAIPKHRLDGRQAVDAAQAIKEGNNNWLDHHQKGDVAVGDDVETKAQSFSTMHDENSKANTFLTLGDEGGHIHGGETLGNAIQAYRKRCGLSHYDDPEILARGEGILNKSPKNEQETYQLLSNFFERPNPFKLNQAGLE